MKNTIHRFVSCKEAMKDKQITSHMSELIKATDKDGNERFFKICLKNDQIRKTKHCVGDECGVIPAADCNRDEITVGWFHTHPEPGKERLSVSDIMYGIDKDFSCVGFRKDYKNKVLCYDYPYSMSLKGRGMQEREESDIFSYIENKLEKGIKRDCEEIVY